MLNASRTSHHGWRVAATACALAAAIILAGCGKKQDAQAVVGQVIAHVGPDEVTQQEVDNELRLANVPADKRSDEIMKAVLSRVIERKYLVQQAIAAKLDREPTVHLDLLRSREQTLAGAYIQRDLASKASAISKAEVDGYIQGRQVFQVEQISFPPQKDLDSITAATKDFKSLDKVEAKLNELGVKFNRGPGTVDSATIPPELLKTLEAKKTDDIFLIRSRTAVTFFKVASVDEKPLTGDDAGRFARRALSQELARKISQQTVEAALANAKYEGDYARIMAAPTPAANLPAPAANGEKPAGEEKPAEEKQKEAPKN